MATKTAQMPVLTGGKRRYDLGHAGEHFEDIVLLGGAALPGSVHEYALGATYDTESVLINTHVDWSRTSWVLSQVLTAFAQTVSPSPLVSRVNQLEQEMKELRAEVRGLLDAKAVAAEMDTHFQDELQLLGSHPELEPQGPDDLDYTGATEVLG